MNEIMFKHLGPHELLRVAKDQATTALEKALTDRLEDALDELDADERYDEE